MARRCDTLPNESLCRVPAARCPRTDRRSRIVSPESATSIPKPIRGTDGGAHWKAVLNLSYPWYWFAVKALNTKDVVISGFYDSSTFEGIIRWSHDGGATWPNDIVLTSTGWVQRVRFASHKDALIMDLVDGSTNSAPTPPTVAEPQRTGPTSYRTPMVAGSAWNSACCPICTPAPRGSTTATVPTPERLGLAAHPSARCSMDRSSLSTIKTGWVAGGEISPRVEGWVHRTADGGKTWSGRTRDDPWPIREIRFVTPNIGGALGGNIYSKVGGM
jgi:hypothetical protein